MKSLIPAISLFALGVSQVSCEGNCPALRLHVTHYDGSALAAGVYRIKVTVVADGFIEDHECQIPSAKEDSSRCRVEGNSIDFVFDGHEYAGMELMHRLLVNGKTVRAGSLGAVRDPMPALVPEGECSKFYSSIIF